MGSRPYPWQHGPQKYEKCVEYVENAAGPQKKFLLHFTSRALTPPNIFAGYYDMANWLFLFNMNLDVQFGHNLHAFRHASLSYKKLIEEIVVDTISLWDTGKALMAEIDANNPHQVFIVPFWQRISASNYNSVTGPKDVKDRDPMDLSDDVKYDIADATARGMPIRNSKGRPIGGSGTGKGTNSLIQFSPEMWKPGADGIPTIRGSAIPGVKRGTPVPGTSPDEALFHELVHATRQMRGVQTLAPANAEYENEEEYLAVIISNIYISNKNPQAALRGGHNYGTLQNPEKFRDDRLFVRFFNAQREFYRSVAQLPADRPKFNPVRQFDERWKAGKVGNP